MLSRRKDRLARSRRAFLAAALIGVPLALVAARAPFAAENPVTIPPPAVDATTKAGQQTAILAGGCFWGVQGVFQHVKGVTSAVSGYAGGSKASADYETVSGGSTGHAESVKVTFDPSQVSYGQLLQIYFSVVHDPTQLNRQGPDSGTQYRSAIFPTTGEQAKVAQAYIAQLDQAKAYGGKIVTKIEGSATFYPAEGYHQDFLEQNPTYPYIVINDLPKVENLKRIFPQLYRSKPVLVASSQ